MKLPRPAFRFLTLLLLLLGALAPVAVSFAGAIGRVSVTVEAEGGHYTRVTVATDQVGESEADKLAKRFLTLAHAETHPAHRSIGAY